MTRLFKLHLAIVCGLAACGTDPAPTPPPPPAPAGTTPTISGVVPDQAFIGREVRVEVSGDATQWADSTTVSFGPGVTVHSVVVASATLLFADVSVADTASAGLVDVTVTGAAGPLVLHAAFDLEPPLQMTTIGTLAQGSVVTVHLANLDFAHPFDLTKKFGEAFPNLDLEGPPGTTLQEIDTASAFEIDAILSIDVDAQPGELVVNSGPQGHGLPMSAGNFAVAPRTAIPLAPIGATTGAPLGPFESALYELTPAAAPSVTMAEIDGGGFLLLPASGHFIDAFDAVATPSFVQVDPVDLLSTKYYAIYVNDEFPVDTYQLTAFAASLAPADEITTSNDTAARAQLIQLPALFENATLSSSHDVDFVKFAVDPADIGKTVHLVVEANPLILVDIFADPAGTISLGETTAGGFDDFTSDPIPDGTTAIWVKLSAAGDVDPELDDYFVTIFVNP